MTLSPTSSIPLTLTSALRHDRAFSRQPVNSDHKVECVWSHHMRDSNLQ